MKLRNKKTGEIIDGYIREANNGGGFKLVVCDKTHNRVSEDYASLVELNAEWEDYEEPKKHYEILAMGVVMEREDTEDEIFRDQEQREIGNYFETREEAEKAVEKLKAAKRLKDNGYRFNGVGVDYNGYKIYLECDILKKEHYTPTQDHKDLDLLFGGEV